MHHGTCIFIPIFVIRKSEGNRTAEKKSNRVNDLLEEIMVYGWKKKRINGMSYGCRGNGGYV